LPNKVFNEAAIAHNSIIISFHMLCVLVCCAVNSVNFRIFVISDFLGRAGPVEGMARSDPKAIGPARHILGLSGPCLDTCPGTRPDPPRPG
jgi:hypothetical protein